MVNLFYRSEKKTPPDPCAFPVFRGKIQNIGGNNSLMKTTQATTGLIVEKSAVEIFYEFLSRELSDSILVNSRIIYNNGIFLIKTYRELCEKLKLDQALFANYAAEFHGYPRVFLSELLFGRPFTESFSTKYLRDFGLFPYEAKDGVIKIATADPSNQKALHAIGLLLPKTPIIEVAAFDEIEIALKDTKNDSAANSESSLKEDTSDNSDDIDELRDLASGAPVVQAVEHMLERAVDMGATDIHVEPFKNSLQIRVRVDGILRPIPAPRLNKARAIISRIKIMANLNIAEHRLPQDGRARIRVSGKDIDIRVATMPTMHGESAILRLLEHNNNLLEISQLGLSKLDQLALERQLDSPYGLIIVTGPTGSGKTTTLASILARLNDTTRKILTIEDPVEYDIPGVCQSQIKPLIGLTFAASLRAFLRQDPDIIMVGEMRDSETAKISIQASLTGHLVLTTLHTNTAASAITRLVDMGIEPFLIGSSLLCIVAQRLLRILCLHCKRSILIDEEMMMRTPRYRAIGIKEGDTIFEPVGCERCTGTGYRGRRAVFEVLEINKTIRHLVTTQATDADIEKMARTGGMTTMIEDGLRLCLEGMTSVDEVFRVSMSR